MSDATTALLRAISVNFVNLRPVIEAIRSRDWASATFLGARHELTFRIEGDGADAAADTFLRDLTEREFDLRGHVLIDIAALGSESLPDGVRLSVEALTMEDL